jgi:hypothetical protein
MKGIDIIIPVHEYNPEVSELLKRCLESIQAMALVNKDMNLCTDVCVVGPSLPTEEINKLIEWDAEFTSFNIVENSGKIDFCSQVNYAVENGCHNEYFIVVEFDDIVTAKWVKMALPYIESRPKCPIFLPLVEVYDIQNPNAPLHYINELGWSSSFAENELGSLTNAALQDYCNFNFTGSIVKRSDFIKAGGLKPSIKLAFGYELLLRLAHFNKEVYVVPKVGYFHFVNRDNSLTSEYHRTMTQEEGSWWIKLAIEECQHKKDRNKTYSPDEK